MINTYYYYYNEVHNEYHVHEIDAEVKIRTLHKAEI